MNEKFCIYFRISLKFVPTGPIDSKSALVRSLNRLQAITWTNADPVHRCIYAAQGGDELRWIMCFKYVLLWTGHFSEKLMLGGA